MEELKLYIVEFDKYSVMKAKEYPIDYILRGDKYQLIIVIIHDEYTFSTNNGVQRV